MQNSYRHENPYFTNEKTEIWHYLEKKNTVLMGIALNTFIIQTLYGIRFLLISQNIYFTNKALAMRICILTWHGTKSIRKTLMNEHKNGNRC